MTSKIDKCVLLCVDARPWEIKEENKSGFSSKK